MHLTNCSVVICTANRSTSLKRTLKSIIDVYGRFPCDVLVVDNNSKDNTKAVCEEFASAGLRRVLEPVAGLSQARNAGLAATVSELVVFIDDDVAVRAKWLEELVAPFSKPDVAVVGGELEPVWEIPRPDWLQPRWAHFYSVELRWSKKTREISGAEWLCEGNIAFRRQPLLAAGGFPTHLGRVGSLLLSGDGIVVEAIQKSGGRAIFCPSSVVDHFISADRIAPKWLIRRAFWQGVTSSVVDDYRIEHLQQKPAREWRDVRLPTTHTQWEKIFNAFPDSEFDQTVHDAYELGYTLHRVGLVST